METKQEKPSQKFKTDKKWSFDSIKDARAFRDNLIKEVNVVDDNPRIRIKKRDHGASFDVLLKRYIKKAKEEAEVVAEGSVQEVTETDSSKQRRRKKKARRK